MAKRGRVSAAALAVVPLAQGQVHTIPRPDAPYGLTDREAAVWRAIVDRMPADWFPRETQGLLTQFCRHECTAERIGQLIHQAESCGGDGLDIDLYDRLLRMQARESAALKALAASMRISQQATRSSFTKLPAAGAKPWKKKLWEFTGDEDDE